MGQRDRSMSVFQEDFIRALGFFAKSLGKRHAELDEVDTHHSDLIDTITDILIHELPRSEMDSSWTRLSSNICQNLIEFNRIVIVDCHFC